MSAAWRNSVPTLRLLLKLGAAPSTKDHLGWKARDFTTKFGVRGMSEMARAKILDDLESAEQSGIAPVAASRIIKRRASKTVRTLRRLCRARAATLPCTCACTICTVSSTERSASSNLAVYTASWTHTVLSFYVF